MQLTPKNKKKSQPSTLLQRFDFYLHVQLHHK